MLVPRNLKLYIGVLLFPLFALAAGVSVELEDGTVVTGVQPIEKQLSASDLTLEGITVGDSTLANVSAKFGGKTIHHEGDAAKSIYVLCYQGADGTVAAFESNDEMGGKDHVVTNVVIVGSPEHYHLEMQCSKSGSFTKKIKAGGLQLGMTKTVAEKLKGKPSKAHTNFLLYEFHTTKKTPQGNTDINSTLILRLTGNEVSRFSISKIESY